MANDVAYDALFTGTAPVQPVNDVTLATLLRCSMGLSAWKEYRSARWALRVNPSSGNLHPTESYLIRGGRVSHYAPREHLLEHRSALSAEAWTAFSGGRDGVLVALTSIHWREAWKYGERAFRYCQHDVGHAVAALRFAAGLLGWRLALLPWSDPQMASVLGLDRAGDFDGAEPEEPECVAVVTPNGVEPWIDADPTSLVEAARMSTWSGRANALSPAHAEWPIIEEVAQVTRRVRLVAFPDSAEPAPQESARSAEPAPQGPGGSAEPASGSVDPRSSKAGARAIILQRRSAVAFDARSTLPREVFLSMLARTRPRLRQGYGGQADRATATAAKPVAPWDAIDWPPHVHLLLFVHRVDGLTPGVYAYLRDPSVLAEWRAAMRSEFLWEPVNDPNAPNDPNVPNDLYLLLPFDVTWVANRVSCDQDIAADGFFSLGMIARLESSLRERGDWFYRRLFWECGMLGQVLYLEAEAAGARATGIGCFYDDPVHEAAGLTGIEWQSLYHFSMGVPVDDDRLTTEPGYAWER